MLELVRLCDHVRAADGEDAYLRHCHLRVSKLAATTGVASIGRITASAVSLGFHVYGPSSARHGLLVLRAVLKEAIPSLAMVSRRAISVRADAAGATLAAGRQGRRGGVYNIGGGSRVTVNEVVELIGRVSGKAVVVNRAGEQKGDMRHTYADTSQAQRDLGFHPSVTLEEGLRKQFLWHQSVSAMSS